MTDENVELSIPVEGEKPIQDRIDTLSPSSPQDSGSISTLPPEVKSSKSTQPQQEELKSDNIQPVVRPKHVGRPCKYCENKPYYQGIVDAYLKKHEESEKPTIPFIEELAIRMKIDDETLVIWAKKELPTIDSEPLLEHPELSASFRLLKTMQKLRLKQRAMGRYNPHGALYLLNADHKVIQTNKEVIAGDTNEPLNINIIEEKPIPK